MLSAPHVSLSSRLADSVEPMPLFASDTTLGWLRSNASRTPGPGRLTPAQVNTVTQQLVLEQVTVVKGIALPFGGTVAPPPRNVEGCPEIRAAKTLVLS